MDWYDATVRGLSPEAYDRRVYGIDQGMRPHPTRAEEFAERHEREEAEREELLTTSPEVAWAMLDEATDPVFASKVRKLQRAGEPPERTERRERLLLARATRLAAPAIALGLLRGDS